MRIALAGLFALTLAACTAPTAQVNADTPLCVTDIQFRTEADRAAFIAQNADSLVRAPESFVLLSHPDDPILIAAAFTPSEPNACPASRARSLVRLAGNAVQSSASRITSQRDLILELASSEPAQDSPYRCSGRILNRDRDPWGVMYDLSETGLRNASVHGDGRHTFFVADETCETAGAIARAALSEASWPEADLELCPDDADDACSDPSVVVGPRLTREEIEDLFNSGPR